MFNLCYDETSATPRQLDKLSHTEYGLVTCGLIFSNFITLYFLQLFHKWIS